MLCFMFAALMGCGKKLLQQFLDIALKLREKKRYH